MASTEISGRIFQKSMMTMIKDLVWKNGFLANEAEKKCDRIYTDKYESAARKLLEYYDVPTLKLFVDYNYTQFMKELNRAPDKYRDELRILWEYEEPNEYYRMLYGKPPLDFEPRHGVYINTINPWGIKPNESFHDKPLNILIAIENSGGLDYYKGLVEKDSTFEYVNHMTYRKIYPFVARLAQNFDLLYVPEAEIGVLTRDFRDTYQMCRDFIVMRYYSEAYYSHYEHYDGMIGMSILFQTIQQMHVKYLDADITRDFYDLDSIRVVYEAYSVPFFENIPVFYHQKIVKMMNRLLMYKGGNQVFFDLCSLFDYESLDVFKYYLLRTQRTDINTGRPKTIQTSHTESGNIDYEDMYELMFVKGLLDGDPYIDICDKNNHLEYWPVTYADPFWVNDQDLLQKVYRTHYNYTETKYIGLQMVFSMTKFLFESTYFMQMIAQNRNNMSYIRVSHGKLGMEIDLFTLIIYIHAIIYTRLGYMGNIPDSLEQRAIIMGFNFKEDLGRIIEDMRSHNSEYHAHNGSSGIRVPVDDIPSEYDDVIEGYMSTDSDGNQLFVPLEQVDSREHPTIRYIYWDVRAYKTYVWNAKRGRYVEYLVTDEHYAGLDGDNNVYKLARNIYDDLMTIDNVCDSARILEILEDMEITNISSCAKVYNNIKDLYMLIEDRLIRCKDPETYFAYKHLYKLLLTTQETPEIFKKSDGTVANTILELLEDLNMALAIRISNMTNTQLVQELQYSLAALEKVGADLKYIHSYGGIHGKIISEYLYQLIRVFKSAKVDLVDFRAIYVIDGRMPNMLKLMTKLKLESLERDLPNGSVLDLLDDVRLRMIGGCNRTPKEDLYWIRDPITDQRNIASKTCSGLRHSCEGCEEKDKKCGCKIMETLSLIDELELLIRFYHVDDTSFSTEFYDIIHSVELIRRHAIANDKLPLIDNIEDVHRAGIIKDDKSNMFVDKLIKLE